jgi:outer membrane protein TolC
MQTHRSEVRKINIDKQIHLFVFFLISIGICHAAPTLPEKQLPELELILESARINAPDLIEQDLLETESDLRLKQAKSAYYPKLDVVTNFGYRKDFRQNAEDTDNLGFTYSANLNRPLYYWGAIEARIEQARIDNDNNSLNYQNNLRAIERRIRADYLNLILDNIALENELKRKDLLEGRSLDDQINYDAGKLSEREYRDRQRALASSLLKIEQIQQSKKRIAERFKFYAGWHSDAGKQITTVPMVDLDQTESWILEQLNQIEQTAWFEFSYFGESKLNDIQHQEEAITLIESKQKPLVSASMSASQNQTNTSSQNNVDTFSVFAGIQVSWNIFDGFQTKNEKIEAEAKLRRFKLQFDQLSKELQLQAAEMLDQLLYDLRYLRIQSDSYVSEVEDLKLQKQDADKGRISELTLQDATLQLQISRLSLNQNKANLLLSLNDYFNLVKPILP